MTDRATLAQPLTEDDPQTASDGTTVTIGPDGEVYFDAPSPAVHTKQDSTKFNQNLAETLDDSTLSSIAEDYIEGVNADILSRSEFIQNYNSGIDLLGLKLDVASASRGTRTSISKAKNASLLQACVRSQSGARSQLLPPEGPAKIQTISGESGAGDELARKFGNDFNYFITEVDKGFYPDTDRMLFYRAFGGSAYKKVYRDPILQRPTSRFMSLDSLIVSEDATDLMDALRKTNELVYSPVQVKRMMAVGAWMDFDLGQPQQNISPARVKVMQSQGLSAATTRSQDLSHTIYEGYWHFCAGDYGWDDRKADADMPAPYRVVLDRDSRKVLALHRNWKPKDDMFRERQVFVKYGLVPGLGFLDYGFLHLIGNQVRVLTALIQILVDKGMLSNFPGGLKVKGVRTATNELNPGLGEWVDVDIGGLKSIKDAMMGMPYGEISTAVISLMEMMQKDVDQTSGQLEIPTATGNANTPVGTILAVIEQQAQNLTAVQQRDHRAQKDELRLIRDLFAENPKDLRLLQRNNKTGIDWATKVEEFTNMDLVPVSDPNIPSQTHRILINQFIMDMAKAAPDLFGSRLQKVARRVLTGVGVNDADDLLAPPAEFLQALNASKQPKPAAGGGAGGAAAAKAQMELPLKQAELGIEQQRLQIEQQQNEREAANQAQDGQLRSQKQAAELATAQRELDQQDQKLATEQASVDQEGAPDPETEANVQKTRADAFQSVAMGVQSLASANQTAQQGEQEAKAIEEGATPSGVTQPAPEPQPGQSLSKQPLASKKAKPKKPKAKP